MIRTTILAVGLSVCAGSLFAQQHAPTLDVCKADLAVWYDQHERLDYDNQELKHLSDGTRNTNAYNSLTLTEAGERQKEMAACWAVSGHENDYYAAATFYASIADNRRFSFIIRHNLMEQLVKEDDAGVR